MAHNADYPPGPPLAPIFEVAKKAISPKSLPFVCPGGCSLLATDACINDGDTKNHYGAASAGSSISKTNPEGLTTKNWILPNTLVCCLHTDSSVKFPTFKDEKHSHHPPDANVKTNYKPLDCSCSPSSVHNGKDYPTIKHDDIHHGDEDKHRDGGKTNRGNITALGCRNHTPNNKSPSNIIAVPNNHKPDASIPIKNETYINN